MPARPGLSALLALAGPPLGRDLPAPDPSLPEPLRCFWTRRNGWRAFWSALEVFPVGASGPGPDVGAVNTILCDRFGGLAAGHFAFGQDLFGMLMTWHEDHVCAFDPETGEHAPLADGLDGWAAAVLADPEQLVGSAFAFDWQERHGALQAGERLVPLLPFVLGGEYEDTNLEPRDTLRALRERAVLAWVVATLPDGADVEWPLAGTREE